MKRAKTPTFLLEGPLQVDWTQQQHLRAHLEAARCLYNALLHEANKRLQKMRNDPAWQGARTLPRSEKQARAQAFSQVRKRHHFSEYELHEFAKTARVTWIADHIDSTMAQTLATRAYQAVNRVCVGRGKRARFRSRGRGLDSVEGKRNDVGMRFVLDPGVGDGGFLLWQTDVIPAIIDWLDPVVLHGLRHPIKSVRLVRRKASSPRAQGADHEGNRYYVQLVLEGHAFVKPKHEKHGSDTIGLDIGPSTLAIVPREGKAALVTFCEELVPHARQRRRLQRKSLHGHLAHEMVKIGNTITIEKTSFKAWQKQYGKSIGLRAPGMFVAHLERLIARTGGTLTHISTFKTRLSQSCHACGRSEKKPRAQRWHHCSCGFGPVQRDLYSAFLLAYLEPEEKHPSITQSDWEGAEPRLRVVMEALQQRANEGHPLPRSMGLVASQAAHARARRHESSPYPQQEPALSSESAGNVG